MSTMHLEGLLPIMRQLPSYPALLDRLRSGGTTPDQHLLRAARPFVSAALAHDLSRPVLLVTARVERAYNVAEQLPVWLPNRPLLGFAEPSSLFYERSPWAAGTIRSRLDVLATLCPPIGNRSANSLSDSPSLNSERGSGGEASIGQNGHAQPYNPSDSAPVIVASALALMQRTLPLREFPAGSRILQRDQQAQPGK